MSTKENASQNIWFGVAMFLIGLIAGVVLTFISVGAPSFSGGTGGKAQPSPSAPTAPQAPSAPQATVEDRMLAYAADIGVDTDEFEACIGENAYTTVQPYKCTDGPLCDTINQQMSEGQKAGVTGTPGNILYSMKTKKARLLSGAQPIANFQRHIEEMLKDANADSTDPAVPAAQNVTAVDIQKDHVRGSPDADLAIIEYSDYECPFCHRVHPTYQQLMDQYEGKILWVYRHYPLNFHAEALPLAIGAECVGKIAGADAYWQFTDKVMSE